MQAKSPIVRWGWFAAGVVLIWAFMFQLGPAMRDAVPEARAYGAHVADLGFNLGAVYYTDVELFAHANIGTRSTIEHMPRGPGPVAK
jgi:hypothetical protein